MVHRVASLYGVVALAAVNIANAQQSRCTASTFQAALSSNATVQATSWVPNGGSYGEGAADIPYPTNPTNLPELCAMIVKVTTSPQSSYRFGLYLPTNWTGRFLAVGNGGFAGGINWLEMAPGPHYGMASMSTDTGHSSNVIDMTWALNNPETKTDFGYRAMGGSVELAKKLITTYYGKNITRSYYNGCSSGGRQGLKQIQIAPDTFDGIVVGAPAWYSSHINPWVTQLSTYNFPVTDPKRLNLTQMGIIAAEVLKQCDTADGVRDSIISAPEACTVNWNTITCGRSGVDPNNCITAVQVNTAKNIYSDWKAKNGTWLYSGLHLGSEWNWLLLTPTDEAPFGLSFLRYYIYDNPNYQLSNFSEQAVNDAIRLNPGMITADKYDLSAFKSHGGKIIMWHGLADGIVPTKGSDYYYTQVMSAMGGLAQTTDFFRYFKLPGVQHCWGTPENERAPWNIAGGSQAGSMGADSWSVPGFRDAKHDVLLALVDWVEKGTAVDTIIATTWQSQSNASTPVLKQRPLCPYPQKQVWNRRGDLNLPSSWSCGS